MIQKLKTINKKHLITISTIAVIVSMLTIPATAMAARDLGEIFEGLGGQAGKIGIALVLIAAAGGIGCIIAGGVQWFKASKGRGEATFGKGAICMLVGVVLVCIVAFAGTGSKTIFGDDASMSDHISDFE